VKVWDAATGTALLTFQAHPQGVVGVGYSADGRRLATCGTKELTIKVWDATGRAVSTLTGHTAALTCVAFSADGTRLISGARGRDDQGVGRGQWRGVAQQHRTQNEVHSVASELRTPAL